MRSAELIHDTFVNLSGLTIAVTKDRKKKVGIYQIEDLEPFAKAGRKSMKDFVQDYENTVDVSDEDDVDEEI